MFELHEYPINNVEDIWAKVYNKDVIWKIVGYELVIFDMDGTIADTSPCIMETYRHTAREFSLGECSDELLKKTLENNLLSNLRDVLLIPETQLQTAADYCLNYYLNNGYRNAKLYDGVRKAIVEIESAGKKIGLATLSHQDVAEEMLEAWGLTDLFSTIHGSDPEDTTPKSMLIEGCISDTGTPKEKTVMIGDSMGDYRAAMQCGVSFIAASYGFNLNPQFCSENGIPSAMSPSDIPGMVLRT